jgi:eukaryotic-like serine/threonine-protein kinase
MFMTNDQNSQYAFSSGTIISSRYEIISPLGVGGMGAVYLAKDRVLENTQVAIKVLHPAMSRDAELSKRFLREVTLMHKVNHQNVVRVFDVGNDQGWIYFTMEYVSGVSLENVLDKSKVSLPNSIQIIQQVCLALQAIHAAEIIHRDLKPANIMLLNDKTVKLTDFGVARAKNSNLTQHDEIIGSVEYMAPEVWLGKELSPATDFYSLGVILYELVTGDVPFQSDEPATMMWMHVKRPATPPKSLNPEIPNWLNQLILKLLAKSPTERPKTAGEIIAYLNSHLNRQTNSQSSASFPAVSSSTGTFNTLSGIHNSLPSATGTFPNVTNSNTIISKRTKSNKRKRLLENKKFLSAIGSFVILTVALWNKMMWLVQDLFPY